MQTLNFTPVCKRVKTKSQKVLEPNFYACRSSRENTGKERGGEHLNRVKGA